ncbi:MAG: BrnT family toxin [Gammaproteobacteria bacterium]|nr:BrnT family toxin [Gammaproteobacteria bacterium]
MRFEWNEIKRISNLDKHDMDFVDAAEMFEGPMLVRQDTRKTYGEERFIGFGFIQKRLMAVVYASRKPDIIRIISLRKANKREQERFKNEIEDKLEKD